MITLTRLSGTSFAINPDLIERVDATPDTVLTLVDGTKYVVLESLDDVTDAVRFYRASLLSIASKIEVAALRPQPHRLRAVSDSDENPTETATETQPPTQTGARVVALPGGES